MLIRLGYDIIFDTPLPVPMVALLRVHPSREKDLRQPDILNLDPAADVESYVDGFGNNCCRFYAPAGQIRLRNSTVIHDTGEPDPVAPWARQIPVQDLPHQILPYLLNSRYCEVDRMVHIASELFGATAPGWERVQAVCSWVHRNVTFGYEYANATKTALDVFGHRFGVCRDFQHLAVTLCRASGRHRRSNLTHAHGFQRLVRSVFGESLVGFRRAPQPAAYWPGLDGRGARRLRRSINHFVRRRLPAPIHRGHRRSGGAGDAVYPRS